MTTQATDVHEAAARLTPAQTLILRGCGYDVESRRARTRARNELRACGLMYSEGNYLTPFGEQVLVALDSRAGDAVPPEPKVPPCTRS